MVAQADEMLDLSVLNPQSFSTCCQFAVRRYDAGMVSTEAVSRLTTPQRLAQIEANDLVLLP